MIGQTISHYKITEKLGEGGMGVVYKAEDTQLDRMVAIKFLSSGDAPDDISQQRFEQEAKSAAALSHSNICHIYGYAKHEGRPFLVMEYLEGDTLRTILEDGPLSIQQSLNYARQIAQALAAAHEQGIVHRDIKPANIMIGSDGQLKVMDFGLAKLEDAAGLTQTGSTVGTMAYMSPEQIKGEPVDRRSDIFSLGVVFYEMLTGATPFRGEHQAAMTYAIVNEEPIPISNHMTEVPEEIEQIFRRCLAKDPNSRYGAASELLSDLQAQETISELSHYQASEEMNHSYSTQNWSSRKQIVGASAVGIVVIVLLSAWWLFGGGSPNKASDKLPPGSGAETTEKSVAVLPFEDYSPKNNQQWFSDGLTEEILNSLARLPELQVPARTSSFLFRDTDLPVPEIADSLNVNHIVEGSVRRSGQKMRITAQLIRGKDGTHIWSNSYNVSTDSVFKVQQDIAEKIASALDVFLDTEKRKRMFALGTRDVPAYEAFLKGKAIYNAGHQVGKLNLDTLWIANRRFQEAMQHDPQFAAPYYYHQDAYVHFLFDFDMSAPDTLSERKVFQTVESDLQTAINISQNEGERIVFRLEKAFLSKQWNQVPDLIQKLEQNQKAQQTFVRLGGSWAKHFLIFTGHAKLIKRLEKRIIDRNPLSAGSRENNISSNIALENFDDARVQINKIEEITGQERIRGKLLINLITNQHDSLRSIIPDSKEWNQFFKIVTGKKTISDTFKQRIRKLVINSDDLYNLNSLTLHAAGDTVTLNKKAAQVDSTLFGPQKMALSSSFFGGIMLVDPKVTPNLRKRLEEADVEVTPYTFAGRKAYKVVQK